MNDQQMQSLLETWFNDTRRAPRDGARRQVMAECQSPLALSSLPLSDRPAPVPPTTAQPASSRCSPRQVRRRGVIVALFGGFLLAAPSPRLRGHSSRAYRVPSPYTDDMLSAAHRGGRAGRHAWFTTASSPTTRRSLLRCMGAPGGLSTPGSAVSWMLTAASGARRAAWRPPTSRGACGSTGSDRRSWEMDPVPVSFWDGQVDAGPDGRLWRSRTAPPRSSRMVRGSRPSTRWRVTSTPSPCTLTAPSGSSRTSSAGPTRPRPGAPAGPMSSTARNSMAWRPVVADDGLVWLTALADEDVRHALALRRHRAGRSFPPPLTTRRSHAVTHRRPHDTTRHAVDGRVPFARTRASPGSTSKADDVHGS